MLISRISGCKGNGFYLIRKELSLIYFPQPFFQFAGPLAFVDEIVAESPAVSADGIGVQAGRYTVFHQCHVVVYAIGYRNGTVIAAVHDEGLRRLWSDLQFVRILLFEFL